MIIKLPWKIKSYDRQYHRAILEIVYRSTHKEDTLKMINKKELIDRKNSEDKFKKLSMSGLRKCPGHKFPKTPTYNANGQCSICSGYKKSINSANIS